MAEHSGEIGTSVLYAVVIDEKHRRTVCSDQAAAGGTYRPWVFFSEAEAEAQRNEWGLKFPEFTYRTVPLIVPAPHSSSSEARS